MPKRIAFAMGMMTAQHFDSIEDLIPVRSLWTNILTGRQIIITRLSDDGDWADRIEVGSMGHGGCKVSHLLDNYVMASETCTIEARPH